MKFDNVAYDKLFPREKPKKHVESTVEDFEDDYDVAEVDDVEEDDLSEVEEDDLSEVE